MRSISPCTLEAYVCRRPTTSTPTNLRPKPGHPRASRDATDDEACPDSIPDFYAVDFVEQVCFDGGLCGLWAEGLTRLRM